MKATRLLTKTLKTKGKMYSMKLNIPQQCFLIEKNNEESLLWNGRMCHQSAHTLQDMIRGNHSSGLPHVSKYDHKCSFCVTRKQARAPFPISI